MESKGRLEKYRREYPDPKTIVGVVYSNPRLEAWEDTNGKRHPACYFKVFVWAKMEKIRACVLFEQAEEAMTLKKYDKVRISGNALLVETVRGKKFYNFNVNQIEVLPNTRNILHWDKILERIDIMLDTYEEVLQRINRIEKKLKIENIPEPRGDKDRVKKMQSLRPLLGDIYQYYEEDDEDEDED